MSALLRISLLILAAAFLFTLLFLEGGIGPLDFWWSMAGLNLLLVGLSLLVDSSYPGRLRADVSRQLLQKAFLGVGSAGALYLVFWLGNYLAPLVIPGAAGDIGSVYSLKTNAPLLRIVLLIALIIGPGEELFWRGFVQQNLSGRFGAAAGFAAAAALYAAVHLASGNVMLVLAALVCGLFWGAMYFVRPSLVLNCVSHTVWDLLVFVLFPFQ